MTKRKRPHQSSVRVNITLPPALITASRIIIAKHGYAGISDYIQARIRRDAGLELPT